MVWGRSTQNALWYETSSASTTCASGRLREEERASEFGSTVPARDHLSMECHVDDGHQADARSYKAAAALMAMLGGEIDVRRQRANDAAIRAASSRRSRDGIKRPPLCGGLDRRRVRRPGYECRWFGMQMPGGAERIGRGANRTSRRSCATGSGKLFGTRVSKSRPAPEGSRAPTANRSGPRW